MASYLSSCSVRVSCLQRETREGAGAHSWRRAAVVLRLRALDDVPPFALAAAGDGNQIQRIGPTAEQRGGEIWGAGQCSAAELLTCQLKCTIHAGADRVVVI
jgi:hypothetical protein